MNNIYCPVCGNGIPLCGPIADRDIRPDLWVMCEDCVAEGWKDEPGDDVMRAISPKPGDCDYKGPRN